LATLPVMFHKNLLLCDYLTHKSVLQECSKLCAQMRSTTRSFAQWNLIIAHL